MSAVQAASIALAAGLLKFAASKISPPITSEFACIKGVTKDLSLLRDIHGEISSWLQKVHGGAIDSDPSLGWVIKLKNVADDICELLHEVHLEAERNKTGSGGEKYYAIADCFTAKPKLFMYRCKIAHRIKEIKLRYASIVKQRSDTKAILTNCEVGNMRAGEPPNVEEAEILQSDQNDDIICEPLESNEGDDGWIVVTKNQDQSVPASPTLAGGHGASLEEDFVDMYHVESDAAQGGTPTTELTAPAVTTKENATPVAQLGNPSLSSLFVTPGPALLQAKAPSCAPDAAHNGAPNMTLPMPAQQNICRKLGIQNDELQPIEAAMQEFLASDVPGSTADLEDIDAHDALAAVVGDGIADLQDGALNLQAEAQQAEA